MIILTFTENTIASRLFGQNNEHLIYLEKNLEVSLTSRGNELILEGEPDRIKIAKRTMQLLEERARQGDEITTGDVDGALRQALVKKHVNPELIHTNKLNIHARTPTQNDYIKALKRAEMVFGIGPAGTGKTWLAVAYAVSLLDKGAVVKIILTRPAVEAGERLGFLPGDMKEKVDPYLRPIYDALYDVMDATRVDKILAAGIIEIAPLAFMRGRTLKNAAIILDEAQNTTTMQMKMALTRLGDGSRMIITGDPSQIDLPTNVKSGLVEACEILQHVEGIEIIHFKDTDVVRHPLVGRIVKAYEKKT
jgi:phosphate starvation-inducible protein PhoH and related proteins